MANGYENQYVILVVMSAINILNEEICATITSVIYGYYLRRKFLASEKVDLIKWYLSQGAACDGLIYFVNYSGQISGMQGYSLLLFED